ncbi:MAG: alpha-L-fucosidase [bacterium]
MKPTTTLVLLTCLGSSIVVLPAISEEVRTAKYQPAWESLDQRPIPAWFDNAKFGIFVVWGIYSVPAWAPKGNYAEWYGNWMNDENHLVHWFHEKTYGKDFKYPDFVPMFTAEMFDPEQWADLFAQSGAQYVVLTANYHDGFCLWPSSYSWNWNSVDLNPHRDLVGELTAAVRSRGLTMGCYYSLYEWYNPLYRDNLPDYVEKHFHPQFKELVERYQPWIIFADGEWEQTSEAWRSPKLLAWLFNESAVRDTVVVNDRWGKDTRGVHGGYYTSEYGYKGRDAQPGKAVQRHKWEENQGIGASYGFNRLEGPQDYKTSTQLIHMLADIVSQGGNLLLDVGPTADGRIPVIMQERLLAIGEWLRVNGEAIYGTRPWTHTGEGDSIRYTTKKGRVYAISLRWPAGELLLEKPQPSEQTSVRLLGWDQPLSWKQEGGRMRIAVPPLRVSDFPTRHAYVFELSNLR